MFATEASMQLWMRGVVRNPGSLQKIILPIEASFASPSNECAIIKSYQDALNALIDPEIVYENQNISTRSGHVLRPDFVLFSRESGCFFVVELKNNIAATRQAGTEIGAYSAAIRETYPNMAGGNIIVILVSMEWPALLLSSALNQVFYEKNTCLFLRPVYSGTEIKLACLPPNQLLSQYSHMNDTGQIHGHHLDIIPMWRYNLASRKDLQYRQCYKNTMYSIQAEGRNQKSHGFAFLWHRGDETEGATVSYAILSQKWPESKKISVNENSFLSNSFSEEVEILLANGKIVQSFSRNFGNDFVLDNWITISKWENLKNELLKIETVLISFCCWGSFECELIKLLQMQTSGQQVYMHDDPQLGLHLISMLLKY